MKANYFNALQYQVCILLTLITHFDWLVNIKHLRTGLIERIIMHQKKNQPPQAHQCFLALLIYSKFQASLTHHIAASSQDVFQALECKQAAAQKTISASIN